MANEENLVSLADRTTSEKRKIGMMGGKASGEARRRKRELKNCLTELLEKEIKIKNGETVTGAEALSITIFQKALKGDLKAFELVRDTSGQKPVEKVAVTEIEPDLVSEIESMVEEECCD